VMRLRRFSTTVQREEHLDCAGHRDLAAFALHQLPPMLVDLKKRYYAKGFAE
jgi:hypothetical protein